MLSVTVAICEQTYMTVAATAASSAQEMMVLVISVPLRLTWRDSFT